MRHYEMHTSEENDGHLWREMRDNKFRHFEYDGELGYEISVIVLEDGRVWNPPRPNGWLKEDL